MQNIANIPDRILKQMQTFMEMANRSTAESSKGEIEQASARLKKLLMEYNIEQDDLHRLRTGEERKPDVIQMEINLNGLQKKTDANWVVQLYFRLSKHNLCRALRQEHHRIPYDQGGMIIIGTIANIEMVNFMVEQLVGRIRVMCRDAYRNYNGTEKVNTFSRGYCMGVVEGIDQKLRAEKEPENNERGLILRNDKAVDNYIGEHFPFLRGMKSKGLQGQGGRALGQAAGRSMNLGGGIGPNSRRLN